METKNEYREVESLKFWDKNPRKIKKEDFERLKNQILSLGQYKPLLITEDGVVIGGNMRLRAYRELGIKTAWVSVVDAKDEETILKYAFSDNDRAGYYDDELLLELQNEFPEFKFDDFSVDLEPPKTLSIGKDLELVEDEVPEPAEGDPISKYGEVYQLGRHRLMCGDSTKIEDVEKLMNGQKADMVFTDPPYGVDYQSNMRTKSEKFNVIDNDDVILTDWIANAVINSTGWILFCTTWKVLSEWLEIGKEIGDLSNMIIWDKGGGGIGDLAHTLLTDYEIILAYNRGNEIQGKRIGSVWSIDKDNPNRYKHPTQKPVELSAQAIQTFSSDSVLDLFGGSGSTLIACEQLNRTCYIMEIDPLYCDVIRKRYAKFVGREKEWEKPEL